MISTMKYCAIIICSLFVFINTVQADTFWEKRRKAYDRLKKDNLSESDSIKRNKTVSHRGPSSKANDFGNKEIKHFKSTEEFRNPYNITIPAKYGEITEIRNNKNKPLVINIQDYHCHYEAQKQIAFILEELMVNAGLKLVMVEGNSKDASLKHLRTMATRERRIEVAEDYLKRGMISGAEYLDIISEYDFKALGIEEKELYMKNLDSFLEIEKFMKDAKNIMDDIKLVTHNLKSKVYSKYIYEIDTKRKECDDDKISFDTYGLYLLELAQKKRIGIHFAYPNIQRVFNVVEKEKELDVKLVNKERDVLIQEISKTLSDEELSRLLYKSAEFKNKRINEVDFHRYLQQVLPKGWDKKYPSLAQYITYINEYADIDVMELFNEFERIEDAIVEDLFKNDHERTLWKLVRNVEILSEFYALELISDKYKYFKSYPEEFRIPEWKAFLDRMVRKYKLTKTVPQDVSLLVNKMARVDNFYQLAQQRDHVFVKKIERYMNQENADMGVLITGGFHSSQLSDLIYNAGYSFMTVLPTVTEVVDDELYHSVLKYKANLMKQAEQNK